MTTEQAYEALVLDLAINPGRLKRIKRMLCDNLLIKPLFNSVKFTVHLESGYQHVHRLSLHAQSPIDISVLQ